MSELELEGIELLELLAQAGERLRNAAAAGEMHGNRELREAALSLIPVIESVRAGVASVLEVLRSGRALAAREEACSLERKLWMMRMSVESSVPPYFRRLMLGAIASAGSFARRLCSEG